MIITIMDCFGCKYFFKLADIYKDSSIPDDEGICNNPGSDRRMIESARECEGCKEKS